MGYAEFGGTGSVQWQVKYRNVGESRLEADKPSTTLRASGVDRDTGTTAEKDVIYLVCTDAMVTSICDGTVKLQIRLAYKKDQITLSWGEHETTARDDTTTV